MTDKEKKDYIRKNWAFSSGKKITLMLQKYWGVTHSEKSGEKSKTAEDLAKEVGLIA